MRKLRRKLPLFLLLGALIAFPQYASAQGDSGIDQYLEQAPGSAGGDRPSGSGPPGSGSPATGPVESGGSPGTPADPGTVEATGGAGAAAGGGAADGSAAGRSDANGRSRQEKDEGLTTLTAAEGSDHVAAASAADGSGGEGTLDALFDTLGGEGVGIALPIILGASLVGALLLLVARRRGGSEQAPTG